MTRLQPWAGRVGCVSRCVSRPGEDAWLRAGPLWAFLALLLGLQQVGWR